MSTTPQKVLKGDRKKKFLKRVPSVGGDSSAASTTAGSPSQCSPFETRLPRPDIRIRYAYEENAAVFLALASRYFIHPGMSVEAPRQTGPEPGRFVPLHGGNHNSGRALGDLGHPVPGQAPWAASLPQTSWVKFFGNPEAPAYFAEKLGSMFRCQKPAYVLALRYIQRLARKELLPGGALCRVVCASLVVAVKFFDDLYYTNKYYAQLLDLNPAILNELESELLKRLDFRLDVAPEEYKAIDTMFEEERYIVCAQARRPILCNLTTKQNGHLCDAIISANTFGLPYAAVSASKQTVDILAAALVAREFGEYRFQTEEEFLRVSSLTSKAKHIHDLQKQFREDYLKSLKPRRGH
ncbi:cyclin [Gregarina niphandrodes]|uniref:Cyclin n=1 Tax=Gregarina niphandrodes TaxID=110365 RepID=A0A023B7D7_GRENI|nr:cyclin [Gregarina niphandrodes]EZG67088.1 cyclin [Gregarina niphandrodes]|eukprot:XP_011130342.1 cyclin [Gregarina niphandrodes]